MPRLLASAVYELTPDQFRGDTKLAKDVLEDASGAAVTAYRAPTFIGTVSGRSIFLANWGFASVERFPDPSRSLRHAGARYPHRIRRSGASWARRPSPAGSLECARGGRAIPQLFPLASRVASARSMPPTRPSFYLHPWDSIPNSRGYLTRWQKWRHYVNLHKTERKLDLLLGAFKFGTLREVHAASGRAIVTRPDFTEPLVESALSGGGS